MKLYTADPDAIERIVAVNDRIKNGRATGTLPPKTEKEIHLLKIKVSSPEVRKALKDKSVLEKHYYDTTPVEVVDNSDISFIGNTKLPGLNQGDISDRIEAIKNKLLDKDYIDIVGDKDRVCWEITSISSNANMVYINAEGDGRKISIKRYLYNSVYGRGTKPHIKMTCGNNRCVNPLHMLEVASSRGDGINIVIGNKSYDTLAKASRETKISKHTIKKFTHDKVFNVKAYRYHCYKKGISPLV